MLDLLLDSNLLSSIIAFAIILIPAIIIHELGHFVAAKMVGINVLEFGVGFPPRMMRLFTWGETEFTLNWLPIGGFVRPLGEDMLGPQVDNPPDDVEYIDSDDKPKHVQYISEREELMARGVPEHKLQSVNETPPWSRIWFMIAGAVFNVVSAVIFFIIAALLGIPIEQGARIQITTLPDNSVLNQPEVFEQDAIELVDGEYFATEAEFLSNWVESNGEPLELTMRHPDTFEEDEALAGERYTITVTPNVETILPSVLITGVAEESPAEAAGLQPLDRIITVEGQAVDFENPVATLSEISTERAGSPIALTVLRENDTLTLTLTPRENPPAGQGRIGVAIAANWQTNDGVVFQNANPQVELIPQSAGDAIVYGFERTGFVLKLIVELPGQIISGAISPEQARPVSIVGISQIGGQFLQQSIRDGSAAGIFDFIALISIFLGITNLLPFPPLDGGRIVFVLIEIVRGKPVSPELEAKISSIGIAILLGLGVIVIIFDILNPLDLAS